MLYLIGVDHSVQHNGRAGYQGTEFERLRKDFPLYLSQVARNFHAEVIADESNQEVLEKFSATKSVVLNVAKELGVKHVFCEPSVEERKQLRITGTGNPQDYEKREKCWLKKLTPYKNLPILFVVGAKHIESFSKLASKEGMSIHVAEGFYGREYFAP